jgi:hypothetical protein
MLRLATNSTISSTEDEATTTLLRLEKKDSKLAAGHASETEALPSHIFF